MNMKMMEVGQNGVLLEIVVFRQEVAKEQDIGIVILPKDLKEDYRVLDPIQIQKTAKKTNVMVGTFVNVIN